MARSTEGMGPNSEAKAVVPPKPSIVRVEVLGRASSASVQKVLWCCAELGIEVRRRDLGGSFGGLDDPAYLALNPNGRIPTVVDGDLALWESNTIMRYLVARAGGSDLHPSDPGDRALVERWMDWQIDRLTGPMFRLFYGLYLTRAPLSAEQYEKDRREAAELWSLVDRHLTSSGRYLEHDCLTLADLALGPFLHRWHAFPIDRPALPNLARWYNALRENSGYTEIV